MDEIRSNAFPEPTKSIMSELSLSLRMSDLPGINFNLNPRRLVDYAKITALGNNRRT